VSGQLLPQLKKYADYQKLTKTQKEDIKEQNQDCSLSIRKSSTKKANIYFNKARTLIRDINFTSLRKRFSQDFSNLKKLILYMTPEALETRPLNKVRSENIQFQKEIEKKNLYRAFSENPNKMIYYPNNWKISSFENEQQGNDSNHYDEIEFSTQKVMPIRWKLPKPGKFSLDKLACFVDKSQ